MWGDLMQIRRAEAADEEELTSIRRRAILTLAVPAMSMEQAEKWATRATADRVARAILEHEIWVAVEGATVGWVEVDRDRVAALYISPSFSRRGIGSALLARAETSIRNSGYATARLEASQNALGFYLRRAYFRCGPPDADGAWPLRKDLAVVHEPVLMNRRVRGSTFSATRPWLLDSDPSIRWQVMRDLTGAPADEVASERARVATEGAGARLLALQSADGRWGGAAWNRGWNSTMHVLMLLRDMGLDPASDEARRAVGRVRDRVTWKGCGPPDCDDNHFFSGEVEPCINGQVGAVGAYFGQDVRGIVDRLLAEQLSDGGWNCEAANGSPRSSFNTTICVLEALLEYERAVGGSAAVTGARLRGQEYLLERRLFRRRSTGEAIERDRKSGASWTRFAFPTWWHYDVLRGLEYLRRAAVAPDQRVAEAIDLVTSKRDDDGRWRLETRYPGDMPVEMDEGEGRPSRWNTLRALRVLDWYSSRHNPRA